VRPLARPEPGQAAVEFLTRLRQDARLFALPPKESPPRQGGRWPGGWHDGTAWIYGRWRRVP